MKRSNKNVVLLLLLVLFSTTPLFAQTSTSYDGPLGYTVAFDIASYTDTRDKTLEDVLSKVPGTYGSQYNGMPITKIFVNGNDIRSSYSTISGMKPDEIEKVEFIENFQAVEVLRGRQYTNVVAMNIVLKDPDSSDWTGSAKAGTGGSPALYDGNLYAIRIGSKSQNMFNFKANNIGTDFGSNTSDFVSDELGLSVDRFSMNNYVSMNASSGSVLSSNRNRFNNSYYFNTVNTTKLSDKMQLFVQASYVTDRNKAESAVNTTNYLQDSISYEESNQFSKQITHSIKSNIAVVANTSKYYFSNLVYAKADLKNVDQNLTGTFSNDQTGKSNGLVLRDDITFLKPLGNWIFTLFSQNQFTTIPQNIAVTRVGTNQNQDISSNSFFSDTKMAFGYTVGNWTISLAGGFDALTHKLETELTGVEEIEVVDNDAKFGYVKAFAQPTANYVSKNLQLQIGLPVKFYHYTFGDNILENTPSDEEKEANITKFEPLLSVKYQVTQKSSLTLTGKISFSDANASEFYKGMILKNYRNIDQGFLKYDLDASRSLELVYAFRLPKYSFFINSSLRYTYGSSKYRSFDRFIGPYQVRGSLPSVTDRNGINGSIQVNKGINKGTVRLYVTYSNNNQTMERDGIKMDYNNQSWMIAPNMNGRLTNWLQLKYEFNVRLSYMKVANNDTKSNTTQHTHTFQATINPTQTINLTVLEEYYHTIIAGQPKNLFMTDFVAEYQFHPRWQAILSITNLLNQKDYSYNSISDLSTEFHWIKIRPRNVLFSLYYTF